MGGGLNFLELILLIFILSFIFLAIYNIQSLGLDYSLYGKDQRELTLMEENLIEALKIAMETDFKEDLYGLDINRLLDGILNESKEVYRINHRNTQYRLSLESRVLKEGVFDVELLIWRAKEEREDEAIRFILREGAF